MRKLCVAFLGFVLFCCLSSLAVADDEGNGHQHHEEMNEVQVGTVHFPTSCAAATQKSIERGVAMLHSFWYEEAQKQFEEVEKDDPNCAIARWGVAMSRWHQLWNRPDQAVLAQGAADLKKAKSLKATPRERDYINALSAFYSHANRPHQKRALAYSNALEKVARRNPDDHEAAAFYALSLLAAEPDHDKSNAYRLKAAAVLEKQIGRASCRERV